MPNAVVRVVDIYQGDTVKDFAKAAGAGLLGVIHKATTGATGQDGQYAKRRKLATSAGLLWGAYHWGTKAKVSAQVDNFLNAAQPDAQTLVALDFEPNGNNTMSLDQAREFLTLVQQRLGRKAVLYSGSLVKEALGKKTDAFFGSHRLWLAQYGPTPVVQKSWSKFWLWQYTDGDKGPDPKQVPGIPGDSKKRLDCDHYEGTAGQLKADWAS